MKLKTTIFFATNFVLPILIGAGLNNVTGQACIIPLPTIPSSAVIEISSNAKEN